MTYVPDPRYYLVLLFNCSYKHQLIAHSVKSSKSIVKLLAFIYIFLMEQAFQYNKSDIT